MRVYVEALRAFLMSWLVLVPVAASAAGPLAQAAGSDGVGWGAGMWTWILLALAAMVGLILWSALKGQRRSRGL